MAINQKKVWKALKTEEFFWIPLVKRFASLHWEGFVLCVGLLIAICSILASTVGILALDVFLTLLIVFLGRVVEGKAEWKVRIKKTLRNRIVFWY